MPIKLTDKISGVRPRGSVAEAIAYARKEGACFQAGTRPDGSHDPGFLVDYFTELYRLCDLLNFDFAIASGQWANETGSGDCDNPNWTRLGNPAGLAITNSQNKSLTYANGKDAARAHMVHLWVYTRGALDPADYLYPYRSLDGHYQEAATGTNPYSGLNEPYAGSVRVLGDLNTPGRWALILDKNGNAQRVYGNRIRDNANAMWPNLPDQQNAPVEPDEGNPPVAKDPFDLIRDYLIEAPVTKTAEGQGFNYGKRDIIGIVQHETQGIMTGPQRQAFFSCPGGERCKNAMVDYGIARNGKIYRFQNPYTSNKIPWASGGGAAGPNRNNPDGKAVDNKFGNRQGGVNSVYAAVEVEKEDDGHMNAAQIEATARLTAYTAAMRGYPATDWKYPDVLGGDVPTSVDHDRISLGTNCEQFADDRRAFEARTSELLLEFYGTGGGTGTTGGDPPTSGTTDPPPTPPAGEIVPGVDWGIAARSFGVKVPGYVLTEGGPLSVKYIERAKESGEWPELQARWKYADGRAYFIFSNGWLALDPPGEAAKVDWID